MTREDVNDIINAVCPNDEDYEKPCISPKYLRQELEQLALDQRQWNKEPTTKNDLAVDCISRDAVKYYIQAHIHEIITESGLDKNAHTNEVLRALLNGVATMPSVTPQKPRKGEWLRMSDLSEQEDDRYKCSRCGNVIHHKNKMDLFTFNSWCGRCGSDNGRHVNYEVEE